MKKIAIASINFYVLSFRCRGLIWGLLTILIILLTPAINAAQQPTSTLAPGEFIASKIEDLVGIWEMRFTGEVAYMQYKADGTWRLSQTIEELGSKPIARGTFWFEEKTYHHKGSLLEVIGRYEVRVQKEGDTPIRLSFITIEDQNPNRAQDLTAGMTWVGASLVVIPTIQAADSADHREVLSKHYRLEKPDGKGPFPAVMMVPGCSGFDAKFQKAFFDSVQSQLVKLGFVTLRVNFLAARNVPGCQFVPPEDTAGDIGIAAEYLQQQPFVKKGSINIMSWSYGAAATLRALRRTETREAVQVDAVVAYYPHCPSAVKWDSEVPVLVLAGAIDNVAPLSDCEIIFDDLPHRDKLTVRVYDNAHHCFDNFTLPSEMQYIFGTVGYNEAAEKSAWKEVTNFLRK